MSTASERASVEILYGTVQFVVRSLSLDQSVNSYKCTLEPFPSRSAAPPYHFGVRCTLRGFWHLFLFCFVFFCFLFVYSNHLGPGIEGNQDSRTATRKSRNSFFFLYNHPSIARHVSGRKQKPISNLMAGRGAQR
ncbi:uncharacterized protein LY89DRAFT_261200 [Mollisia scopiformis]|uniref:Uncharacterized protein n=1 Tax=Mollisia scopiformis TaxID=149040 RepID=A0A132BEJ4_MOLSC|nr:uncharacterized protein LY89DRAFT_261200 [Mollisia scopiformis]KUJ10429.1 hypothetical protein LY89DRAFT_261200 [Mollisia scopiformis]